jgi:hypothetical protein
MKNELTPIGLALLLASSLWLNAAERAGNSPPPSPGLRPRSPAPASEGQAQPGSPEFERMKTLVGAWTGKTDMGQGPVDITLQYRLLAGGSVLEERCFAGTPNEMVTMYYDQNGKLAMTHYCVFGNRPGMLLKSSDAKTTDHCSFYPMSSATVKAFQNHLKGFGTSKGAIRFSPNKPLPTALVKKLVKARIAENGD